jgi:ribose 5-phosphate isomerase B
MHIFMGADHNGFALKAELTTALRSAGYTVTDEGDASLRPDDDFPQFAEATVRAMLAANDAEARGILICGSGQGMCIAANRFKGIRASLCWDVKEAHAARNDDDSNVLCLPARSVSTPEAVRIAEAWLATPFAGAARYKRRIHELDTLGDAQ